MSVVSQVYQFMHPNGSTASVQVDFDGIEVKVKTSVATPAPTPAPKKVYELDMLCPFCNTKLDEELYNGTYGCDTGCEYVSVEVECPECHKVVWSSGSFGYYENKDEKAEYRAEFMEQLAEELQRIAPDRLSQPPNPEKE